VDSASRLAVWVNDCDHLYISCQADTKAADVPKSLLRQFASASQQVAQALRAKGAFIATNDQLGYVLSSPADVGTGMCVSFTLRLPSVADKVSEVTTKHGIDASVEGDDVCLTVRNQLGRSEAEQLATLVRGAAELLCLQKATDAGAPGAAEVVEEPAAQPEAATEVQAAPPVEEPAAEVPEPEPAAPEPAPEPEPAAAAPEPEPEPAAVPEPEPAAAAPEPAPDAEVAAGGEAAPADA